MPETRNATTNEAITAITSSVSDLSIRTHRMEEVAQTQASKIDQLAQTQEAKFKQMISMLEKMNGMILDLHHRPPENEVIDSQTPLSKFSQVQSSVVRLESKSLVIGFGVMVESCESASASTDIESASIDVTDKSDSAIATGVFEDGDLCLDVSTIDSTQAEVTSDLFLTDFTSVFVSSDAIIGEETFDAKFCVSNTISDLCLLRVCGNASVNFPPFCAAHRALSDDWYPIQLFHKAVVCLNPPWKPPDSRTHIEFLKLVSLPMPANYDMEIVINKEDLCIVLKETETMKGVTMEYKRGTKWLTNSYFFWVIMISLLSKEGLVRIKIRNLKLDVNSGIATPVEGGKDDLIRMCGYSICKLGPSQENGIDVLKNYTAAEYFGYAKHIISRFRNDKEDEAGAVKDSWDYSGNDSAVPLDDVVIYAAAEAYSETMWNKQVSHRVCLQSEVVKWEYADCGVIFPFLLPPAKPPDECLSLVQEYNIWCWTKCWELAVSSIQKGLVLSSNWQGQLNTIKADAKGSKEAAGKSQRLEKLNKNGDEVLIMLDMRGDDDFLPDNIIEIELHNFMTFDIIKCKPGPRLNLVIGPHGSEKSLIVCAIALGLGGEPHLLGRALSVAVFC